MDDGYLDGSATAKAIGHNLNRWMTLTRCIGDGNLPMDDNGVEDQIRPIAIGRNNWLFVGSLQAGKRADGQTGRGHDELGSLGTVQ